MSILYRININTETSGWLSDESVPNGYVISLTRLEPIATYWSDWAVDASDTTLRKIIGAVQVDEPSGRVTYDKKASYADYTTDPGSFFWDNETQELYVNFNVSFPTVLSVLAGVTANYTTLDVQYIGGIEYLPLALPGFILQKEVDPLTVGKMSFISQDIEFINTGGEQDAFIGQPVPGNVGTITYRNDDTGKEKDIYSGFVRSDSVTLDGYTQSLQDIREKESVKAPSTFFNTTDYPDLDDSLDGTLIPEGYGTPREIPAYPLNTNGSGDVVYKYATDGTSLFVTWVKDANDAWQIVTPASSDPANGEVTVSSGTARNGDSVYECKVQALLRNIFNPGDIIKDLNYRYNNVTYDGTNYNQTEFTTESAKLEDIVLYMGEQKNLFEWTELLQTGSDKNFLYDIDGSGKRTLRIDDKDRELRFRIKETDILNDVRPVARDFTEYASKVTALYNKSYVTDNYQRSENTDFEGEALALYGLKKEIEQETLLTSPTIAADRAALIAEDQFTVRPGLYGIV
jgi:hypothetical protein